MQMTIKEIAELAGVHRSTVDKVLHDRKGVSDEVRARVQRIIDEVGYESNPLGKALNYQKNKIVIAAVLLQVDALYEIKKGIEKAYADFKSFNIEIEYYIVPYPKVEEQVDIMKRLLKRGIHGMIISPMQDERVQLAIGQLVEAKIPVVTTNVDIKDSRRMCFVGQDMEKAGKVAGRLMSMLLNRKGKVAILSSSTNDLLWVTRREMGFKKFFAENSTEIVLLNTIETQENPVLSFKKTTELLQKEPELKGLFITCGCVPEICRAVKAMQREHTLEIVCFERYPQIEALIAEGVISCTIGTDLITQGYEAVKILFENFMYDRKPVQDQLYTAIDVFLKENI